MPNVMIFGSGRFIGDQDMIKGLVHGLCLPIRGPKFPHSFVWHVRYKRYNTSYPEKMFSSEFSQTCTLILPFQALKISVPHIPTSLLHCILVVRTKQLRHSHKP